jgi:hypothetical protein
MQLEAWTFLQPSLTAGFFESLQELIGLDWSVPNFSTLCRRQKTLPVAIPYRGSPGPLHLLIDSAGIKAEGEGEWNARKHGGPKRRLWRKIHIGIGEKTPEIRAVEVTSSSNGPLMVCKQTTARQWMHCVKLLGQSLMVRDIDRQVAEI